MSIHHFSATVFAIPGKKADFERYLKWALILAGLLLLWWLWEPVVDMVTIASDREAVSVYLGQFGIVGPLLLGLLLMLQVVIAAIPGEAFMIGGGYVYGFGLALLINVVASVAASQVAFLLARRAGRPLVERLAPAKLLDKWNKVAEKKGMFFFLVAFMLPIFPGDLMNYVAGMSSISGLRFFVANLLGRLPRIAFITAIGAFGVELSIWLWMLILLVAAMMFLIWRFALAHKQSAVTVEA